MSKDNITMSDLRKEVEKLGIIQSTHGNGDNSWTFLVDKNQDILKTAIKQYHLSEKVLFHNLQKTTEEIIEKKVAIGEIIMSLQSPLQNVFRILGEKQESKNQSPSIARMLGFVISEFLRGMQDNEKFRFPDEIMQKLFLGIGSVVDELSQNRKYQDQISFILKLLSQRI